MRARRCRAAIRTLGRKRSHALRIRFPRSEALPAKACLPLACRFGGTSFENFRVGSFPSSRQDQDVSHIKTRLFIFLAAAKDWVAVPKIRSRSPSGPSKHRPLDLFRRTVLALNSRTPFAGAPYLIASRTYNVRRSRITLGEMVAEMKIPELGFPISLHGLPAENRSCLRHNNRVLGQNRGQSGRVVVVERLVTFFSASVPTASAPRANDPNA
jgi:hypothetical protein